MKIDEIKKINKEIVTEDRVKSFKEQLFDVFTGTYDFNNMMVVSDNSEALDYVEGIGKDKIITISPNKILKVMTEHQLSLSELGEIENLLKNSVIAFDSLTHESSRVVALDKQDINGNLIIAIFKTDSRVNFLDVNQITSIYGKKNFERFIERTYNAGKNIYINENTKEFVNTQGFQLPNCITNSLYGDYIGVINKSQEELIENDDLILKTLEKEQDMKNTKHEDYLTFGTFAVQHDFNEDIFEEFDLDLIEASEYAKSNTDIEDGLVKYELMRSRGCHTWSDPNRTYITSGFDRNIHRIYAPCVYTMKWDNDFEKYEPDFDSVLTFLNMPKYEEFKKMYNLTDEDYSKLAKEIAGVDITEDYSKLGEENLHDPSNKQYLASISKVYLHCIKEMGFKEAELSLAGMDFFNTDLSNADFSNLDLRDINFEGCTLDGANFKNVNLEGTDLSGVHFSYVNLEGANLDNTILKEVYAYNTNFKNTSLKNVDFTESQIICSYFKGSNLDGVNLSKSKIVNSDFRNAILTNSILEDGSITETRFVSANFEKANIKESMFSNSNFDKANMNLVKIDRCSLYGNSFEWAKMTGICLTNSDCRMANFSCADICKANLTNTDFSHSNLARADLRYANLKDSSIDYADVSDTEFIGANMENVNILDIEHDRASNLRFAMNIDKNNRETQYLFRDVAGSNGKERLVRIDNKLKQTCYSLIDDYFNATKEQWICKSEITSKVVPDNTEIYSNEEIHKMRGYIDDKLYSDNEIGDIININDNEKNRLISKLELKQVSRITKENDLDVEL